MLGIGVALAFGGNVRLEPATITADTAPSLGALTDGDTLSDAVAWGAYSSKAGTIVTPTTKEVSVDGGSFGPYDGSAVVSAGETYQLREIVEDSAGNSRTVFVGLQTVAAAPIQVTVAVTGNAGEIIFDPIAPLDSWTANSGGAGEIIFEEAA